MVKVTESIKRLSKRKLEEIKRHYDNIPYGFCILKVLLDENKAPSQWEMLYANDAMEETLGISKGDLFHQTLAKANPEKKQERLDMYYRVAYLGEHMDAEKYSAEVHRYLQITCYQYQYGYIACIMKDISQSHIMEMSLKNILNMYSEIYFVHLEENHCRMIYPVTEDGDCYSETVEQRFRDGRILGQDEKNIRAFLDRENVRNALMKQDMVEYHYQRMNRQGEPEWCLTTFTIGEREHGVPKTAIIAIRSMDAHMKEEEMQRQLLENAVKQAEAANLAKSNFLSTMSHDMRTPLNVIFGMSKLAKLNYDNPEKVLDYLSKIKTSSKHLLSLINEVLDMSKIESGKEELAEVEFSIVEMMQDVVDMTRGMLLAKQQTLNYEAKNLVHEHVVGDENRLQQVLFNLISNAEKYSDVNGNIELIIEEIPFDDSQYARFVIHIRDDGIGMSEEFLPRVFEPFKREEDSRINKVNGTGLGTTIALAIVRQMGGNIQVSSVLGEGSEFIVNIPLKIQEASQSVANVELIQPEAELDVPEENMFTGLHALLVEDNTLNAEITTELLKYIGVEVTYAEDGREAVEIFGQSEERTFDCIFMDVQMPEMDGLEATRRIRDMDREDACIPIFAMTANVFTDDVNNTRKAGMQEHIGKPMELENICKVLYKWFPDKLTNRR